MKVKILKAKIPVMLGNPDVTPYQQKVGILIGKNLYVEHGLYDDGKQYAISGDLYIVDLWDR